MISELETFAIVNFAKVGWQLYTQRGYLLLYNASTLEPVYQGRAPTKSVYGLHSKVKRGTIS